MFNLSNGLTLLRAPLAFLFLLENTTLRIIAVVLAMFTDSIDGYLARRSRSASRFGAILDPAMDKFFVFFALIIFCLEGRLELWQALAMVSRDMFLCIFAIYLGFAGRWQTFEYRSIRWGKVTTAFQFIILIGLCMHIAFPIGVYAVFILFGTLAFIELFKLRTT